MPTFIETLYKCRAKEILEALDGSSSAAISGGMASLTGRKMLQANRLALLENALSRAYERGYEAGMKALR